jgi:hypothetical protein
MTNGIAEPPAWAVAAVDQRIAQMMEHPASPFKIKDLKEGVGIVMLMLTEPREGATIAEINTWENACDNCGTWCQDGVLTGVVQREIKGIQVAVVFGSCPSCAGEG